MDEARADLGFLRLAPAPWAEAEDISIDYAVMEKASNLSVVPFAGGWSDLGGWDAVWHESGPDAAGNVCSDHAIAIDCHDTLLRSESPRLELVGIGLEDIVAVAMPDAVLVARKSDGQRVKEAVAALKARKVPAGRDLSARPPALGLVRKPGHRPALSGEAHRRPSRRRASACKATTTARNTGSWSRARPG